MVFDFSKPDLDLIDLDRRLSAVEAVSPEEPAANSCLLGSIGLDGKMVSVTSAGSKKGLSVGADVGSASDRDVADYVLVKLSSDSVEEQATSGILLNVGKVASGDVAIVSLLSNSSKAWVVMKSGAAHFSAYARLDGAAFTGAVTMAQTLEVTGKSTLNELEVTTSATIGGDATVNGDVTAANATVSEKVSTKELEVKDPTSGTGIVLSESSVTPGEFTLDASNGTTVADQKVIIKASEVSLDLGDGQQASPLITQKELEEGLPTVFSYRAGATATVSGATTFDLYVDYCFCPKTKSCSMFLMTLDISLNAPWTPSLGDLVLSWKDPAVVSDEILNVKGSDLPVDLFDGLFMPEISSNTKSFGVVNLWTVASTSSFTGPVELGRFQLVKDGNKCAVKINVTSTTQLPQGTYRCRYQVQAIAPVGKKSI